MQRGEPLELVRVAMRQQLAHLGHAPAHAVALGHVARARELGGGLAAQRLDAEQRERGDHDDPERFLRRGDRPPEEHEEKRDRDEAEG